MPVIVSSSEKEEYKKRLRWIESANTTSACNAIISPEICQAICEKIRAGAYISTACEAVGIRPRVVYTWLYRGTDPRAEGKNNEIYRVFANAVKQAEAEREAKA